MENCSEVSSVKGKLTMAGGEIPVNASLGILANTADKLGIEVAFKTAKYSDVNVAACSVVIKAKSAAENPEKSTTLKSPSASPNTLVAVNFFSVVAIFLSLDNRN